MMKHSSISSIDSIFLYEIAYQDPLQEGVGVYIARAIVDYYGWCYLNEANLKSMPIDSYQQIEEQIFTVAPNPSNGQFEVSSTLEMEKVELFDLTGKIIKSINLKTYKQLLDFNLQSGIYILQIQFTNGTSKTAKIEVQ